MQVVQSGLKRAEQNMMRDSAASRLWPPLPVPPDLCPKIDVFLLDVRRYKDGGVASNNNNPAQCLPRGRDA